MGREIEQYSVKERLNILCEINFFGSNEVESWVNFFALYGIHVTAPLLAKLGQFLWVLVRFCTASCTAANDAVSVGAAGSALNAFGLKDYGMLLDPNDEYTISSNSTGHVFLNLLSFEAWLWAKEYVNNGLRSQPTAICIKEIMKVFGGDVIKNLEKLATIDEYLPLIVDKELYDYGYDASFPHE
jgi:hypothetical protein